MQPVASAVVSELEHFFMKEDVTDQTFSTWIWKLYRHPSMVCVICIGEILDILSYEYLIRIINTGLQHYHTGDRCHFCFLLALVYLNI